jgi:hypothetical protein
MTIQLHLAWVINFFLILIGKLYFLKKISFPAHFMYDRSQGTKMSAFLQSDIQEEDETLDNASGIGINIIYIYLVKKLLMYCVLILYGSIFIWLSTVRQGKILFQNTIEDLI